MSEQSVSAKNADRRMHIAPMMQDTPRVIVFDLETGSPQRESMHIDLVASSVVQFAAVQIGDVRAPGVYITIGAPIGFLVTPPNISKLAHDPDRPDCFYKNSVRWADVQMHGRPFDAVAQAIHDILDGAVWIGHNIVGFDIPVLMLEYARWAPSLTPIPALVVDTLRMTMHLTPLLDAKFPQRMGSNKLSVLASLLRATSAELGPGAAACATISPTGDGTYMTAATDAPAHDATADVETTHAVYALLSAIAGPHIRDNFILAEHHISSDITLAAHNIAHPFSQTHEAALAESSIRAIEFSNSMRRRAFCIKRLKNFFPPQQPPSTPDSAVPPPVPFPSSPQDAKSLQQSSGIDATEQPQPAHSADQARAPTSASCVDTDQLSVRYASRVDAPKRDVSLQTIGNPTIAPALPLAPTEAPRTAADSSPLRDIDPNISHWARKPTPAELSAATGSYAYAIVLNKSAGSYRLVMLYIIGVRGRLVDVMFANLDNMSHSSPRSLMLSSFVAYFGHAHSIHGASLLPLKIGATRSLIDAFISDANAHINS